MKCLTRAAKNPDSEGRVLHLKIKSYTLTSMQMEDKLQICHTVRCYKRDSTTFSVKETLKCKLRGCCI